MLEISGDNNFGSENNKAERKFLPVRNLRLDGIRGLAVLSIMLYHFLKFPEQDSLGKILQSISNGGWIGVDLFFVLSGFLITGILVDSKNNPDFFKNFYIRRTLRIFPLYYFYLLLYFLFVIQLRVVNFDPSRTSQALEEFPWVALYGTNILIAIKNNFITSSLNHLWSLAVEEHFYLILPSVIYFFNLGQIKRLYWLGIVTALGLRTSLVLGMGSSYGISVLTPCRIDSFLIGGLCAILITNSSSFLSLKRLSNLILILSLVSTIAITIHHGSLDGGDPWIQSIGYTILSLLFGALIVRILASNSDSHQVRLFESSWLRFLGKYSYGIYIFHHPLNIAFERIVPTSRLTEVMGSWLSATILHSAIATAMSIVVALLSWHLLEKHFLKLKDKFSSGH